MCLFENIGENAVLQSDAIKRAHRADGGETVLKLSD